VGLLAAFALAAASVLAVPPAATAAPIATDEVVTIPTSGSLTVSGRGWGHGRGMSQYGAKAQAEDGRTAAQILAFYYPGTVAGTVSNPAVRALISADTDNSMHIIAEAGMTATDASGVARQIAFPEGTATQLRVRRPAGALVVQGLVGSSWVTWGTAVSGSAVTIAAPDQTIQLVVGTASTGEHRAEYRGAMRAAWDASAARLRTVNVVPLESYLRSVVPAEMPSSWSPAAVQAQAVAARTYAEHGRRANTGRVFDVWDTTQSQVYSGVRKLNLAGTTVTSTGENSRTDAAISATRDQIRTYGGAPAFTQFGSSNGGWTKAGSVAYQQAVADPWDARAAAPWSTQVTAAQIRAAYPTIGTPRTITVLRRDGNGEWGGRVLTARITGSTRSVDITGDQFRSALGLRSDWWRAAEPFTTVPRPTVSGTVAVGSVLTAVPGAWVPTPGQLAYQWLANGAAISGATTSTYTVRAADQGRTLSVRVTGTRTGTIAASATSAAVTVPWAPATRFTLSPDLNGDGRGEVLAVRGDQLVRYPWTASGTLGAPQVLGSGFTNQQVYAPGDWNGDRKADVITVRTDGLMFLYPGTGNGTLASPRQIGNGWQGYRVVPAGDLTGDRVTDLLGIPANGDLKLYRGNGRGGFVSPYPRVGNGWVGFDLFAAGDITRDGRADILSVDSRGALWAYAGRGNGTFLTRTQVGNGWGTYTLAAGADLNGDGTADIVGRDDKTGTLYVYTGRGGGFFATKRAIGTGW
jgi:SpoIID/LytB domain protein